MSDVEFDHRMGDTDLDWLDFPEAPVDPKKRIAWAIARAQAAVLLQKYSEDEPRDEGGRWTDGGSSGGDSSPAPAAEDKPSHGIEGLPSHISVKDPLLQQAIDRGAYTVTAKEQPAGKYQSGGPRYEVTITAKIPPGIEKFTARPARESTAYYDPKLADLKTFDAGEKYLEHTIAQPKPGLSTEIKPLPGNDIIYRGMRAEEYEKFLQTGKIESTGAYNLGGQEGLTYWGKDPATAMSYANGFAPWPHKATFEKPAYVVATKMPKETRVVPGTGENEVGVARPIDKSEIVGVWRGDAYEHIPGVFDLVPTPEGHYQLGGGVGGSSSVVWQKEKLAAAPAGGRDQNTPSFNAEEHNFLVSARPTVERLDQWDTQLTARSAELQKEGKAGNEEDMQISQMQAAISSYGLEDPENLNNGSAGLNAVYHVNDNRLLAAAFTHVGDKKSGVANIQYFGATSHNSGLKALQHVSSAFGDKASQIEAQVPTYDNATQAIFEAAGYKPAPGSSGPLITYVKETPSGQLMKPEHGAKILGASQATAKLLDYDPNLVSINMGEHPFKVGEKTGYKAAGLAHLDTGKIEMFPRQLPTVDAAVSVTAHEVAHQKYETVLKAIADETAMVMADPDTRDGMNADGSLKPPLDAKYPIYSRFVPHEGKWNQRVKDDGLTQYSKDYWEAVGIVGKGIPVRSAEHETIAEMARLVTDTGTLKGAKPSWRSYYRDIMKTYDEIKGKKKP